MPACMDCGGETSPARPDHLHFLGRRWVCIAETRVLCWSFLPHSITHARAHFALFTHACTLHACTHACMHFALCTHAHTHARTHARTHACLHTHTRARAHARTHARTYTPARTHKKKFPQDALLRRGISSWCVSRTRFETQRPSCTSMACRTSFKRPPPARPHVPVLRSCPRADRGQRRACPRRHLGRPHHPGAAQGVPPPHVGGVRHRQPREEDPTVHDERQPTQVVARHS